MKFLLFVQICLLTFSCALSDKQADVSLHSTVQGDEEYFPNYRSATKRVDVFNNLEMIYTLNVTHLSAKFTQALTNRRKNQTPHAMNPLKDTEGKIGFFVSIFSPEDEVLKLNNKKIWDLYIEVGGQKLTPTEIKSLTKKEIWSPYFSYIHNWSKEYLVIFDKNESKAEPGFTEENKMSLVLSDSNASTKMIW